MPTIIDLAKQVTHKSVDYKFKVNDKIKKIVDSGKSPDGEPLSPAHKAQLEIFLRWLGMNILLGEEMAPAENILNY